jgi:hypothetical protein
MRQLDKQLIIYTYTYEVRPWDRFLLFSLREKYIYFCFPLN